MMDNVEGRWFSFSPQMSDLIILEKGTVPSHLSTIENLDKAVTVTSILSDLADHGEVTWANQTILDRIWTFVFPRVFLQWYL